MSWYDDDEYDNTEEIIEDYEEERSRERGAKAEQKGDAFTISFNTKTFVKDIAYDVASLLRKELKTEIMRDLKAKVLTEELKETMMLESHAVVKELIDEFMKTEKIVIGGNGFYDDTPRQEFTLQEYSKKCIGEAIKSGSFKIVKEKARRRYDNDTVEELGFEEYIQQKCGINDDIKIYIDNFVSDIRDTVNKQIKETFDESMKNTLTSSLLQMLTANASYKKLSDGIAQIASRKDDE